MNITVIGTGYVGLVTGACLADLGHTVKCLDIDKRKIDNLKSGIVPFYEPGLDTILEKGLINKRLSFTSSYSEATKDIMIYFNCVGTPPMEDGSSDLRHISDSLINLSKHIKKDSIIFIKSTVPVGTNSSMQNLLDVNSLENVNIRLASNPEFLKEGDAVRDFMRPDRIVIGTHDDEIASLAKDLYQPLNKQKDKMIIMKPHAAELTKYASNSFLATKISFMNELARLCDTLEIDIEDIRKGMGSDPRIGSHFLYAGLGYGGSCFPKDIDALLDTFKKNHLENKVLSSVKLINETQFEYFLNKILKHYADSDLSEKSFSIWGLSFKPETDDIRDSVSIKLIKKLSRKCKRLFLYDPVAAQVAKSELQEFNNLCFVEGPYDSIKESNALIICTEWKIFWNPDFNNLRSLKDKIIFDGRNILNGHKVNQYGLEYLGIGT